jgi:hypothetical protein
LKKKLEADLNELEIGLDQANKANVDAQKNLRIANEHIKDVQLQLEDEIRMKNEVVWLTMLCWNASRSVTAILHPNAVQ